MKTNLELPKYMHSNIKKYHFIVVVFLLISTTSLWAQVSAGMNVRLRLGIISLLDIEPNNTPITLNYTAPSEAGNPLMSAPNTTKWLNYTSALEAADPARTISVVIDQTIAGIDLQLLTSNATGGGGTLGTPAGLITLSTAPIFLITGIRGAYTGDGAGNGHQLTYSLSVNDYSAIVSSTQNIIVTYTISN
jgi:hypothetical protein